MATNTQDYTGIQKAAILLIALGPERSADIFKHLKEDEIEELTLEIANTRSVSPQVKEDVLNEFYQGRHRLEPQRPVRRSIEKSGMRALLLR